MINFELSQRFRVHGLVVSELPLETKGASMKPMTYNRKRHSFVTKELSATSAQFLNFQYCFSPK